MTRKKLDPLGEKMIAFGSDGKSSVAVEFHVTTKGVYFYITSTDEKAQMISVKLTADDMRNLRGVINNCLRCETELSGREVPTRSVGGLHSRYR